MSPGKSFFVFKTSAFVLIYIFSVFTFAWGHSPEVQQGIDWLIKNQNPNRTWGSDRATDIRDTCVTLETLYLLEVENSACTGGVRWLQGEAHPHIDALARKIFALNIYSEDVTGLSTELVNAVDLTDGSWGFKDTSHPSVIETVLSVRALDPNSPKADSAVQFLVDSANDDGGFDYAQPFVVPFNTFSFNYSQIYPTLHYSYQSYQLIQGQCQSME